MWWIRRAGIDDREAQVLKDLSLQFQIGLLRDAVNVGVLNEAVSD